MYMGDLMVWLWALLSHAECKDTYNVGSDETVSIRELAERIAKLTATKVQVERPAIEKLKESYVPDISRAKADLGLKVWTPLDLSLQKTLNWARAASEKGYSL
jgi:dTDP-glucose 4,6-dehydratase